MKSIIKIFLFALITSVMIITAASCAKYAGNSADGSAPGYNNSFVGGVTDKENNLVDENYGTDRKIIKNVNESVQTDKYDDFLSELNAAVNSAGGYVSSANYSGESYYSDNNLRHANLTLRIPAEKLSEFTERIDSLAVVTYYNESVQDVTAAYVDVESRIAVLEAEESALLDILKTSSTTADALAVRTRLLDVQADLASLRAQKSTYDDRVSFSTVYMSISEVRRAKEQNPGFFTEVGDTFLDSLSDIGEGLRDFAVWFLGNIIYIVIFAGAVFGGFVLIRFAVRKIKAKKTAKNDTATQNDDSTPQNE